MRPSFFLAIGLRGCSYSCQSLGVTFYYMVWQLNTVQVLVPGLSCHRPRHSQRPSLGIQLNLFWMDPG